MKNDISNNKDFDLFLSAKEKINQSSPDYKGAWNDLIKINKENETLIILHMKLLCLFMLEQYEQIVEVYYLKKKTINYYFENRKEELKKIIALAFYMVGMKKKAKNLYPDIKDAYDFENFEICLKGEKKKEEKKEEEKKEEEKKEEKIKKIVVLEEKRDIFFEIIGVKNNLVNQLVDISKLETESYKKI